MGVLRLVLTAMRGAGTVGVAAVDRLGVEATAPHRVSSPTARGVSATGDARVLDAYFPSQSESAALLDVYLVGTHFDRHASAR
jgi:hypothetical protein